MKCFLGKKWYGIGTILFLIIFITMSLQSGAWALEQPQDTSQLWEAVDKAQSDGLPRTAIEILKEIIPLALERERYGEALKALTKQLVLEANIQGNKPEEKINRLNEEIEKAPDLLVPLLKLIQAQWYWHYYLRNRWRFSDRSTTTEISETDFTTWDLPKLFDKIDELYTEVLSKEELLKSTSLELFADFFEMGTLPLSYRPTLYDFAAFSAISFYQDGDQIRKQPEDAFELDAASDAFAPAEIFLQYSPETTDTSSPKLKAMKLYQKLLDFHKNDQTKEAFVDTDINRLIFVKAYSFGEGKSDRYIARLNEIADTYSSMPLSSLAYYYWAQELYDQENFAEAHKIAKKGKDQHPDSPGGQKCLYLMNEIETKSMYLRSERMIIPSYSEVRLDYKNIQKVHFRIVEDRWDHFLEKSWTYPFSSYLSDEEIRQLISKTPIESWSVTLEETTDYKVRSEAIELPSLGPGFYRLIASWKEDFSEDKNAINIVSFFVTGIAMVNRTMNGLHQGFILDANHGGPLVGAKVTVFEQNRDGFYEEVAILYTDKNGFFSIPNDYERNLVLHAKYNSYELLSEAGYAWERTEQDVLSRTIFFTDRSIYRPGQMIHFKALAIKSNYINDTYDFLPNTRLTIILRDYNGEEVERLDLVTNAFGSVSGTFTAPSGKTTGVMTISCSQLQGSTTIRVEEYKRPKFYVTLDPPKQESALDEMVEISGIALAYTGAPIDEANATYRVVREVRYPIWSWWSMYRYSSPREIAHGRLTTNAEGKFTIHFEALPDRSIPESDEPIFIFRVSVDVTDSSGETRSDTMRISIGYTSMELEISAPEWLTSESPIKLGVSASTLDGQPIKTQGKIKVFKLQQPQSPIRTSLFEPNIFEDEIPIKESDWKTWPEAEEVATCDFNTFEEGAEVSVTLEPGVYRAIATTNDRYDKEVKAMLPLMVIDPTAQKFNVAVPNYFQVRSTTLEVGDTLQAIWGTGYQEARAFIEIEHKGQIVKKYWTDAQRTQEMINWSVCEEHRGGFFIHVTHVHDNRAYISTQRISIPWSNKELKVSFSSFRSKLQPGAEETWTIQINGPEAENVAAELVATLYDASLDAFSPHSWSGLADNVFRQENYSSLSHTFANNISGTINRIYKWNDTVSYYYRTYTQFPSLVLEDYYWYGYPTEDYAYPTPYGSAYMDGYGGYGEPTQANMFGTYGMGTAALRSELMPDEEERPEIDLSQVSTRENLNETAFFYPHLTTDGEGQVSIQFTMPEALTSWKFIGFAHAENLLWGMITEQIVTQKDFMVQPNPPRFLREGDILSFSAKVTNLSDQEQSGLIRLSVLDTATNQSLDLEFLDAQTDQQFSVPANRSRSFYWEIEVPEDYTGVLTYKVVASSGEMSDGEESVLPVLSRRIFVTESLPLPIRGPQTKAFTFDKLLESAQSETLVHQALTLQVVSNPAWYAVQALPYLIEFPYECSEQVFNRLYANALARDIANSNPEIKKTFSLWRETDALESNLEKNEELKSVLLEETPWVRAAESESQSKKRVGLLFEDNQMQDALSRAYDKLAQMQLSDGSWSWFPGGRPNSYITLYIMTGFGRLRHLNIDVKQDLALSSLGYLDEWIKDKYMRLKQEGRLEQNNLSSTIAMYLYGRSFFLDTQPIPQDSQEAVDYCLDQASKNWLSLNSRLSQGHLALACKRFNDLVTAQKIIASLRERSVSDEEMGMFWRELELSWWWHRAPIETQAVMIEAFDEVANDTDAVEDLKVWLLKQKQTQNWKTSKSTADAIYALLLRGSDLLASQELVTVTLADTEIVPDQVEVGTGFYEKKFIKEEVMPDYGNVTVKKVDEGVAWGSLHWQYLEDMSKITPHETPLSLEKSLFIQKDSTEGPVIEPVTSELAVGDLIIVRVVLRVDRDMEYVHMKDYRGSGTEPVNVLSGYKYQGGLAYYESTRDTATHFFIDYLPKGTYVFEYPLRIQHKGEYQMGMATIQCMYAPEFNSHSDSKLIIVQ